MHRLSPLSLVLCPVVICLHLQEEYVCLRLHIPSLPILARRKNSRLLLIPHLSTPYNPLLTIVNSNPSGSRSNLPSPWHHSFFWPPSPASWLLSSHKVAPAPALAPVYPFPPPPPVPLTHTPTAPFPSAQRPPPPPSQQEPAILSPEQPCRWQRLTLSLAALVCPALAPGPARDLPCRRATPRGWR